jgi:hypothetical protein
MYLQRTDDEPVSEIMHYFIFDAYLYTHYPKWLPTAATSAFVCSIFATIYLLGIFYASGIIVLLWFGWYAISQQTIVFKASRLPHGFAWGTIISIGMSYYVFLAKLFSTAILCISTAILVVIVVSLYVTKITVPDHLILDESDVDEK